MKLNELHLKSTRKTIIGRIWRDSNEKRCEGGTTKNIRNIKKFQEHKLWGDNEMKTKSEACQVF